MRLIIASGPPGAPAASECGGGVRTRKKVFDFKGVKGCEGKEIEQAAAKAAGASATEMELCGTGACDKDCEL